MYKAAAPLPDLSSLKMALRRLSAFVPLPDDDAALLLNADFETRRHPAGADLREGGRHVLLVSGWACRCRILPDGRRQIFSFLVPGDSIDLGSADVFLTESLTRAETVDLGGVLAPVADASAAHRRLRAALSEASRADHRRQLDHIVRLGSMPAYEAMAHLLMEFHDRLAVVGLAEDGHFPLPVFQDVLGGSLGLSPAHTSRVLARLRREGLLELRSGWAHLPSAERMRELARGLPDETPSGGERTQQRRVRQVKQRTLRARPGAELSEQDRECRAS